MPYTPAIAQEPRALRIISLAPATTEILFALGLNDEIVGVTNMCNYPSAAKTKEKIGTFSRPDIEKILLLKPDIIFATGLEQAPSVEILRSLNIKVAVSDPNSIEELFISIGQIAKLTHKEAQGSALVSSMKAKISSLTTHNPQPTTSSRPSILLALWHDPIMTIGKRSYLDEVITLAGGKNVSSDIPKGYAYTNIEYVIKNNPDIILLTYMTNESTQRAFLNNPAWRETKAVKNNRVYGDINSDILLRPGPRIVEAIGEIMKRIDR